MIFVATGTTYKFGKLVKAIDDIAPHLKDQIIIQIGRSEYEPKNCRYFRFKDSLISYFKKAELVISHGGAGSTFEILGLGKRLISVENMDVNDSHQSDLLGTLAKNGHILWCRDLNDLSRIIMKARTYRFKKYKPPRCKIQVIIDEFLGDNK